MNHVLHIAAIVQTRHGAPGRAYDRRKLAAGKSPMEVLPPVQSGQPCGGSGDRASTKKTGVSKASTGTGAELSGL